MAKKTYFYSFLETQSKELAHVARELENSIFSSPRTMLTHSRVFMEAIVEKVLQIENLSYDKHTSNLEMLKKLECDELLSDEVRDALHIIRTKGNEASHQVRAFRFSEALAVWEALYVVLTWYVELYCPLPMKMPTYQDPFPQLEVNYENDELHVRLAQVEKLLLKSLEQKEDLALKEVEVAATVDSVSSSEEIYDIVPGLTTIRTIHYKEDKLDIPHFLRDAFLLPQRFTRSERFLVRLGAVEEARIMSELPRNLEGIHLLVKRYNEINDAQFFDELKTYIKEEIIRRKLLIERPGELFFFYKEQYVIVTEQLASITLTSDNFVGIPSLLKQLNEVGIHYVGQLPKELVILAKYKNVGSTTVENLFEQLAGKS